MSQIKTRIVRARSERHVVVLKRYREESVFVSISAIFGNTGNFGNLFRLLPSIPRFFNLGSLLREMI
jgi:hypothetical protein